MTVAQNIAVVPKLVGWDRSRIRTRTDELLELVDLPPREYRKRYPRQLSGGQQQRVGIARAMAADPQVMLMDEPFGAIDAITRTDLQDELLRIQRTVKKTVIFVTSRKPYASPTELRSCVPEGWCSSTRPSTC
jgi:osmoprotectant transport system ATP-binding protein